jgi:predicted nicotinamide N-methyase
MKTRPKTVKTQIQAYGVRVLLSTHPRIRKLKRHYAPSVHGNMHWASSWLLMDYFKRRGLAEGTRVTEVGCGWGLAGIYCAKKHGAIVTGLDIDSEVFPYLRLHSEVNKVEIATISKSFTKLTQRHLEDVDVLIGSDICFWDSIVDPLKRFVRKALRAGVQLVLIADPGRPTFEEFAEYFTDRSGAEVLDWDVHRPRRIRGRILRIQPSLGD